MTATLNLVVFEAACLMLAITVFCRLIHTSAEETRTLVRFAFVVLGDVGILGMAWPIIGWPFEIYAVVLIFAIVFVQLVTARFWASGPPWQFQKVKKGGKR